MSPKRFTLKDLFYFVTLLCILAAVCQAEGGAIIATFAILTSCAALFILRFADVKAIWRELIQISLELVQRILAIRLSRLDLFYFSLLLILFVGVCIIEGGVIIASFAIVTSTLSILGLRCKKLF